MHLSCLLALSQQQILYIVFGAIGMVLILYGFLRRFSRMGWLGLQISLLFAATFLIGKIPVSDNKLLYFSILAGGFFLAAAIVFGLGARFRSLFRAHAQKKKDNWFLLLIDSLFGVVNAAINLAVFVVVLGGFVLAVLWYCTPVRSGILDTIFTFEWNGIVLWEKAVPYLADAMLISVLCLAISGGYKLGLLRSVWTLFMLLLGTAALVGCIYASMKVPFIASIADKISQSFAAKMEPVLASILGRAIVVVGCFLICLLVIFLINLFINLGVRAVDHSPVVRFLDGAIFSVFLYAFVLAAICGVQYFVFTASGGALGEQVQAIAQKYALEEFLVSSPLGKIFYEYNPLRLFLGA